MELTLWRSIERLAPLRPRFVSVTYGADGSTRERTHQVVTRVLRETDADARAAPDLRRCATANDPRHRARLLARRACATSSRCAAIRRSGAAATSRTPGGFAYAADLVRGLRSVADFEISVAAYPEAHPRRPARSLISTASRPSSTPARRARSRSSSSTPSAFLRFRDRCVAAGIARDAGAGHPADHALAADAALRRALRRQRAGVAACSASRAWTTTPARAD